MRILLATFVALLVVSSSPTAWSQSEDPFGGAGADPFAQPPANVRQPKKTPVKSARAAVIEKAKKALAAGKRPVKPLPVGENEAEMRIKASLDNETTQTFINVPLEEAVQTISRTHNIPIVVDRRALEELGLSIDVTVSIDLKNVTLRSFLRLMLRELDLTYLVKDEVLQITTIEAAEQNLVLELYVLPPNLAAKSDQVIKVITSQIVPDTWENLGGPSSAMALDHVLVVSTTSDVHDQTKTFLGKLIEKYGK